jgi:trans-2,3-dihydro-3-hydroxyanthranilate isomerase
VVFEEGVGPVPVEQVDTAEGPLWRMTQPAPRFGPRLADRAGVAASLCLAETDLDPALPIEVVATGSPFLLVPVRDLDALGRARLLTGPAWDAVTTEAGVGAVHVFAREGTGAARARTFAPAFGIAEDPATGSAVGPLGGYLLAHDALAPDERGVTRLEVIQGIEMGRPSLLFVEVDGTPEAVGAVRVAGACVAVGGGWIEP